MNVIRLKRSLILTVFSGAALSVVWAVQELRRTVRTQPEPAIWSETRAQLEERLNGVEHRTALVRAKATKLELTLRALQQELAKLHPTSPSPADPRTDDSAKLLEQVLSDPSLQNLYLAAERACIPERYRPVFRQLALSPAQEEILCKLILTRNEEWMDLDDFTRAGRVDSGEPAVSKLRREAETAFRRDVVALLGEAAYRRLNEHERALPAWEMVNAFAGAVALEGQPLSEVQANELADILATSSPPYREGGMADPNTMDWSTVAVESSQILTPAQDLSFRNVAPIYRVENLVADAPMASRTQALPVVRGGPDE